MTFRMRARRERRKDAVGSPAEFAHADFGGIVGAGDPVSEMGEMLVIGGVGRGERCEEIVKLGWAE